MVKKRSTRFLPGWAAGCVLPVARAVKQLGQLNQRQQTALIDSLTGMTQPADVILVDASLDHPLGFSPSGWLHTKR